MTLVPQLPSNLFTVPYLTTDEYKRSPTGVELKSMVTGASQAQQDQILADLISRASGLANNIVGQNLAATVDVEQGRVRMSRNGELVVQTSCWPIVEVRTLLVGSVPSQLAAVDLTELFIEHSAFTVVQSSLALSTSQGPLQLGTITPSFRAFARWTYVNGWPCTYLTAAMAAPAATSMHVADATGIHTGTVLTLYDAVDSAAGTGTETVTVTGEPVANVVPISATLFKHTLGINVTSLPPAVKQAAIQLVSGLIKLKGNQAVVMRTISSNEPEPQKKDEPGIQDVRDAMWALHPYRAVR